MDGIIILLLLVLLASFCLVIWLTVKAVTLSAATNELRSRQDRLEWDWRRFKEGTATERTAAEAAPAPAPVPAPEFGGVAPMASTSAAEGTPAAFPAMNPQAVAGPEVASAAAAVEPAPLPGPKPAFRTSASTPPALPRLEPAVEAVRSEAPKPRLPALDWEQFMGVKLFAWLGGFALFLGVAFFVKYSFDNNWISPELRVALSFLAGISLLVGGFVLKRKDYAVTAQTLCATGVVILYAATFACHSIYRFPLFSMAPTFLLMALITSTAFLLAVRMEAQVVCVLGMLGGFLTPILLGSNVDNPLGLFGYIALLDFGLIAVARHRRWDYLVLLGAVGTILMQLGWVDKFFEAAKVLVALAIFLGFDVLFLIAFAVAARRRQSSAWMAASTIAVSFISLGFVFYLLTIPAISQRPPLLYSFVLGADLCLLAVGLLEAKLHPIHLVSGVSVFLLLSVWTTGYLTSGLLNWALACYLAFAILHAVYPLVLQRLRPGLAPVWWGHIFPPLALLLVMLPMFKFAALSWFLWPCVLLIDCLAVALALLSASLTAIAAVLLLTLLATATWVLRVPVVVGELPELLLVIGGFAIFFFVVSVFAGKKVLGTVREALGSRPGADPLLKALGGQASPEMLRAQLPAMSAILPFLLLMMVVMRLPLADPSPVFSLALLLVVLSLGVARAFKQDVLVAVGLGCTLALEQCWQQQHFQPGRAAIPLAWHLGFFAVFAGFPFLFRQAFAGRKLTWVVAALSGPAHFHLVHALIKAAYPNAYMGLLPAAFAVPAFVSLIVLVRQFPAQDPDRLSLLAWFGGAALFFITLIFPIQFERQWITLGWALEGAALLWLFHRVPHAGLRLTGAALLLVAFIRLALNPAVLSYHARATTPLLNWYLYSYGVVALCMFAGARFASPPRHLLGRLNLPPILTGLGATLAFFLLNLEIADYFTAPGALVLTFDFTGDFGRDMTYTIAWALFALALLVAGIWRKARPARYAALGLLSLTLLKLFFHDLAQLAQLYRIGALIAVAVIAIAASVLYQRFFAAPKIAKTNEAPATL